MPLRLLCIVIALYVVLCAGLFGADDAHAQSAPVEKPGAEQSLGQSRAERLGRLAPAAGNEMDAMIEELMAEGDYELNEAVLGYDQAAADPYDLILRLRRGSTYYSDAMLGLQAGLEFYVPMLEIARLTEIGAEANFEDQTVSGFFFSEDNTYLLNAAESYYILRGERVDFPEEEVLVRDVGFGLGEFYVSIDLLNQIWPLELDLAFSDQILDITTPRKLPVEKRLEREERREDLLGRKGQQAYVDESLRYIDNEYRLFTTPKLLIDNSFILNTRRDDIRNRFRVSGKNDLLQMEADYNISLSYQTDETIDLNNARFRLTRRAYEDDMLPLGLKLLEIGDVSTTMPELIDNAVRGRGIVLSNRPTERLQYFDEVTIEGVAPAGWEAELYRGDDLLEFRFVDEDGYYRFEDVPLLYGQNRIRVVLYGPQGQVEERVEDFPVAGNMLQKGQFDYKLSVLDTDRTLIPTRSDQRLRRGITKTVLGRYGLNRWMTPFASLTDIATSEGQRQYATLGLNLSTPAGPALIEYYNELGGGHAIDARLSTRALGTRLRLQGTRYFDFESEEAEFGNRKKTAEYEIRADRRFRLSRFGQFSLSALANRQEREGERSSTQLTFAQTLGVKALRLYNKVTARYRDNEHSVTDGTSNLNWRINREWQLRSFLDYSLEPDRELDKIRAELRYNPDQKLTADFEIERDLRNKGTEISANVDYDFGRLLAGVDLGYEFGEGVNMLLRTSTHLGPYGEGGEYIATSENYMRQPLLDGRVYEDVDGDGVYDPGTDLPIEGANLRINGRPTKKTEADGRLQDGTSGKSGKTYITLEKESLENPFLVPDVKGYKTVMRPGTSPYLNFPVIMSGAVDGTVSFLDGRPVPGIRLQLVDKDGEVVKETTTASDGFYTFQYVKPGTYTVRAAPEYQVNIPPRHVSVASDDLFQYGIDLHLMEQAEEAQQTAVEADSGDASGRIAIDHHAPAEKGMLQPAPLPTDGNFSAVVSKVRVGEHPYKTRIVLDLSAPALYSLGEGEAETGDSVIYIDLPDTAWDAQTQWQSDDMPVVKAFATQRLSAQDGQPAGTRLKVTGRGTMTVYMDNLIEKDNGRYMLYVDFESLE